MKRPFLIVWCAVPLALIVALIAMMLFDALSYAQSPHHLNALEKPLTQSCFSLCGAGTTSNKKTPTPSTTTTTCTVTANTNWLHVASGAIVAEDGCTVDLRGFNLPGIEYGDATNGKSPARLAQEITWFAHTFHMNLWRIELNAVWWNNDVAVPKANMHYRAWIQALVKMMESSGNYVLLTKGPQFAMPPCGGTVTYCPSQNQSTKDNNPQESTTGQYIAAALIMWQSVATLYRDDPAVLYGAWNEMHGITPQLWRTNTALLIETIQVANSRAVVFFGGPDYQNGINALVRGLVPAFTEANLVYDFHVYDGYQDTYNGKACHEPHSSLWTQWTSGALAELTYAKQHGAVSFSEWGGCKDTAKYNKAISDVAVKQHVALAYYEAGNVEHEQNGVYTLNSNGKMVQKDYAIQGV